MINQQLCEMVLNIPPKETTKSNYVRFDCDYNQLKALELLEELDIDSSQNDSPTIKEFLDWCEDSNTSLEEVLFEGYMITQDREDARITVEAIVLNHHLSSEKVKNSFFESFRLADEFDLGDSTYRAWWD